MNETFQSWVAKHSNKELLDMIKKTYVDLNGKWSANHPKLGYNGGIMFANLLLFLNYILDKKLKENSNYKAVLYQFLLLFALAYVTPFGAWYDNLNNFLQINTTLTPLTEFYESYLYISKNIYNGINTFEFTKMSTVDDDLFYIEFSRKTDFFNLSFKKQLLFFVERGFNFSKYITNTSNY